MALSARPGNSSPQAEAAIHNATQDIHTQNQSLKEAANSHGFNLEERERERPCVRTSRARSRRRMSRGAERRRRSGR